ncbi:MAG: PilZ domain-containing protein [Myxococcota bacterium]
MAPSGPAKRKLLRPPLRIECAREGEKRTHFLGYAANLSETGVFVQSLAPRPPGTRLNLVLHLAGANGARICSEAEVRWCRGYGGKKGPSAGMGMRFTGMRPADRSALLASCSVPAIVDSAIIPDKTRAERRTEG